MDFLNQLTSQDALNIGAIIVVGLIVLAVLRVVVNVAQSILRMGCLLLVVGVGIYVLWIFGSGG